MNVNTENLIRQIKSVEKLIEDGSVSDEMIATAWILAVPPHIAILLAKHINDLSRHAEIFIRELAARAQCPHGFCPTEFDNLNGINACIPCWKKWLDGKVREGLDHG